MSVIRSKNRFGKKCVYASMRMDDSPVVYGGAANVARPARGGGLLTRQGGAVHAGRVTTTRFRSLQRHAHGRETTPGWVSCRSMPTRRNLLGSSDRGTHEPISRRA